MIPEWNSMGIIPPISPGEPGHSPNRSPYKVSLSEFIEMFGFTEKRKTILDGFLRYRHDLFQIGINKGFQWIDGSFIEDVENLENREPNDLDVVTFFNMPQGKDQKTLKENHSNLFNTKHLKSTYLIDGYYSILGMPLESYHVKQIAYWHSMWSHKRNGLWKGFIEVNLTENDDEFVSFRRQS